ncbi:MAG: hypothetical protein WDM89_15290 [Rhizomicrobium sp.]
MSLAELLKSRGFVSALIVDDAFDDLPIAADLAMDEESWTIFMDDVRADAELVEAAFPEYATAGGNELRGSDAFVKAMWELKGKLDEDLWNRLFGTYERERTSDRQFLDKLRARLAEAGLKVVIAGRAIGEEARACDIIFADLFLGAAQQDFDVNRSIERIHELMAGRRSDPPPVVLMSRSSRLQDKKERFRDDAEMLGALFRVYQKQELLEGATVETTLERFATHHADAVRVAAFVEAWQCGLQDATLSFMKIIRRLDLSDYTNIREVLLDVEGQPLGSYLLDVFDRVLQHEIEGHPATIAAAEELGLIDPAGYPTPYIAGSPDLQDLVARTLWQHTERLRVTGNTVGMPVSFGDVLVRKAKLADGSTAVGVEDEPDALIVLTPACDLIRMAGRRRILLVGGTLKPLDHKTWKYKVSGAGTPIVQLPDGRRMSITWELDDQRLLKSNEVSSILGAVGPYSLAARLRESNALELQQRMLADMGRVGIVSKMPFTFAVDVSLLTPEADGTLKAVDLPVTSSDRGVCITGRDKKGADLTRLILTESSVDEILRVIPTIEPAQINERARETLKRLQASTSFRSLLQRGLNAPEATPKGNFQPLKVPAKTNDGKEPNDEIVGLIVRNLGEPTPLSGNDLKHGAIVLVLTDLEPPPFLDAPAGLSGVEGEAAKPNAS